MIQAPTLNFILTNKSAHCFGIVKYVESDLFVKKSVCMCIT